MRIQARVLVLRRLPPGLMPARLSLIALGVTALVASACNDPATPPKRTPTASATPSPGGSGGVLDAPHPAACAGVKTTTPIQQVPVACAALWAPYNVTMVPPPDVIAQMRIPAPPKVINRAGAGVSDVEAQRIALANQYQTAWLAWAEQYSQAAFLNKIEAPQHADQGLAEFLVSGGRLSLPPCAITPTKVALFPLGSEGSAYFTSRGEPVDAQQVVITVAIFPCPVTGVRPDGAVTALPGITNKAAATAVTPGRLVNDSLLGEIWYAEAAAACSDPTRPPSAWCQIGS